MAESSSSQHSSSDSDSDCDEELEVGNYSIPHSALLTALSKLKDEELIVKSSKGPSVAALVQAFLANMTAVEVIKFNDDILKQLQSCLSANKKGRIIVSKLWRNFHVLRLSASTKTMWQSCTDIFCLPDDVAAVSDMTLQLLLKRIMQDIIRQLTIVDQSHSPAHIDLSVKECNIVRYIAGYVIFKMKKKFPLHSVFFDRMVVTTYDYINISSVDEYSRIWVEQVDRGGLYNVSEEFYNLLREVECVCRRYLDVRVAPSEKLADTICKDTLECPAVIGLWHSLSPSDNIMHILKAIIKLWTNIRVHSFTRQWTDALRIQTAAAFHHELKSP